MAPTNEQVELLIKSSRDLARVTTALGKTVAADAVIAAGERAARNGEAETVDLGQIFDAYTQSRATFVAKVVS